MTTKPDRTELNKLIETESDARLRILLRKIIAAAEDFVRRAGYVGRTRPEMNAWMGGVLDMLEVDNAPAATLNAVDGILTEFIDPSEPNPNPLPKQ